MDTSSIPVPLCWCSFQVDSTHACSVISGYHNKTLLHSEKLCAWIRHSLKLENFRNVSFNYDISYVLDK